MAGPAPKTRGWTARENKHKPKGLHVIVCGQVEVSATNKMPLLSEGAHVGKTLPLDLMITEQGVGEEVIVWKEASFHKDVSANEFDKVDIRWDGQTIASCPVIDDKEQAQHFADEMGKANETCKSLPAPEASPDLVKRRAAAEEATKKRDAAVAAEKAAAAKYPKVKTGGAKKSAKKAATKKKPKAVGGWAKAKKSPKKAAKKTAKRR